MLRRVLVLTALIGACIGHNAAADEAKPATGQRKSSVGCRVGIRFLGGSMATFDGLKIKLFRSTGNYTDDKKRPTAEAVADMGGEAAFRLAAGRYYVEVSSSKELPYLSLPEGYKGHPSHYDRTIEVKGEGDQAFDFRLAEACRLTLKAVDADTGKGIPGVVFVTENATAEMWGIAIGGDNLGAPRENDDTQKTDAEGVFTRLVGPRPGFTYFPWPSPDGYEALGPAEFEIPTDIGVKQAEHVFQFRRKK